MPNATVRIGIIGTGFGQAAQIPGFRLVEGAEVVAVCSRQIAHAEAAARKFAIPQVFDDYEEMIAQAGLDLLSIATPVYLHKPMTMAALEAGCHVLCEKPAAMDTNEARAMYERAVAAGVIHMIDHELRFNPTRMRIAELLDAGYIGQAHYVQIRSVSSLRADPQRPWNWWSARSKGGGALGASGSHQIDLLRWWLGEITAVCGELETFVRQRPDPHSGHMHPVDADDQFAFMARLANGAYAHVFVSYVSHYGGFNRIEIHGDQGSLVLDHDDRLWGKQAGDTAPTELTVPDPLLGAVGLQQNVWAVSFVNLACELVEAIRMGRPLQQGATFYDGLRCQQVLDAVRQSWDERRWVEVVAHDVREASA